MTGPLTCSTHPPLSVIELKQYVPAASVMVPPFPERAPVDAE